MRSRQYQSIKAWQLADDLAVKIYDVTKMFPTEERYGLISQMRRASISVAANIVEGATRASRKEYLQFLSVARGSLSELRYYLHLSKRLGYLDTQTYREEDGLCDETARVLYGLAQSVKRSLIEPVDMSVEDVTFQREKLKSGV